MKNKLLNSIYNLLIIIDYLLISFFFFFFLKIKYRFVNNITFKIYTWKNIDIFITHYKVYFLLLIIWGLLANKNDYYKKLNFKGIKNYFNQILFFSLIVFAVSGIKEEPLLSNELTFRFLTSFFITSILIRLVIFFFYKFILKKGYITSNICVFGVNKNTEVFINTLNSTHFVGSNFKGLILKKNNDKYIYPTFELKSIEDNFDNFFKIQKINTVYISQMSDLGDKCINNFISYCQQNHIEFYLIPNSKYGEIAKLEIDYLDTLPILKVRMFPLDLYKNQIFKSILDKTFAFLFCLLFLSWLFPIISLLILIDSKGPILFIQKRNGLNGKEFGCLKFRTMRKTSTNSIIETKRNDIRVTKIGKFLRKTSLDEIPQFLNVLKGDMSIVGPRPHMIVQDTYYKEIIKKYYLRHYVKPGITGLAQVRGYRGAIDSYLDMEKRITADAFYVRNWSIFLDIKIILQTASLIFKGDDNAI